MIISCLIIMQEHMKKIILYLLVLIILVVSLFEVIKSNQFLLYEESTSQDKHKRVETRVYKGKMPELYVNGKRKTNNEYAIEYSPKINDDGIYSYVVYNESCSNSIVYVKDTEIYKGTYNKIHHIDERMMLFSEYDKEKDESKLYCFDLKASKLKLLCVWDSKYINNLEEYKNQYFVVEVWNTNTNKTNLILISIDTNSNLDILNVIEENNSNGYRIITSGEEVYVDSVDGDSNGMYLYNAVMQYGTNQKNNPFSLANDFAGRISWNQSTRLQGIIELYKKTENPKIKKEIVEVCTNLLSITNNKIGVYGIDVCPELWATKKYSLDKMTPRSDLVNNSCILYALLLAVNENLVDREFNEKVISLGEIAFEYFEKQYKTGHYYWPYGSEFYLDGLFLPWNQQNMFGLVLIEMYKATGDNKYAERSQELLKEFKKEWIIKDDKIVWYYWPKSFYSGWDKEDEISTNTPERQPDESLGYEDINHAGINAKFVLEYYDLFRDDCISESEIKAIKKAVGEVCGEQGYAQYIYSDSEQEYSFSNLISNYFVEYDVSQLKLNSSKIYNSICPGFDGEKLYTYAYLYNNNESIDLKIIRYKLVNNKLIQNKVIKCNSQEDIFKYFNV